MSIESEENKSWNDTLLSPCLNLIHGSVRNIYNADIFYSKLIQVFEWKKIDFYLPLNKVQ